MAAGPEDGSGAFLFENAKAKLLMQAKAELLTELRSGSNSHTG
jgi:hypothetical protein